MALFTVLLLQSADLSGQILHNHPLSRANFNVNLYCSYEMLDQKYVGRVGGPLDCAGDITQGGTEPQECTQVREGLEDQPAYSIQTKKVSSTVEKDLKWPFRRWPLRIDLTFIAGRSHVNAEIRVEGGKVTIP